MSQKLQGQLTERLNALDFYEAHQIYRSIYFRLKRENKLAEAYDNLVEGAMRLLEVGEHNSGADLANLAAALLADIKSIEQLGGGAGVAASSPRSPTKLVDSIRGMFGLMKAATPERAHFVQKCLQISFLPKDMIRKQFAEVLWNEKSFAEARLHFLYSSDSGSNCAMMLVEYQTQLGFPTEFDLMIAQFVLQALCTENRQLAVNVFHFYTMKHPRIGVTQPPFPSPLLNFLCFLLLSLDKGQGILFNTLCNLYEKSLSRDPSYGDYLEQIGQTYFGLEKKHKQGGGLLSGLFQSLFDGKPAGPSSGGTEEAELD